MANEQASMTNKAPMRDAGIGRWGSVAHGTSARIHRSDFVIGWSFWFGLVIRHSRRRRIIAAISPIHAAHPGSGTPGAALALAAGATRPSTT
jgi:hypothetical protein